MIPKKRIKKSSPSVRLPKPESKLAKIHAFLCMEVYANLPMEKVLPDFEATDEQSAWRMRCPRCGNRTLVLTKGDYHLICHQDVGCGLRTTIINSMAYPKEVTGERYLSHASTLAAHVGRVLPESRFPKAGKSQRSKVAAMKSILEKYRK